MNNNLRKLGAGDNISTLLSQSVKQKFAKKESNLKVDEEEDAFNTFLAVKNNIDSKQDYFEVFEALFSKKLKECILKEEEHVLNQD